MKKDGNNRSTAIACLGFLLSLVVTYLAAGLGAWVTGPSVQDWYPTLVKPALTPPSWVFPVVWNTLFFLMATAAWLVWRAGPSLKVRMALLLYLIHLVFNFLWSLLFFGMQRPDLALIEIFVLWGIILATLLTFRRIRSAAGILLLPYLVWVGFAIYLNFEFWRLNP